MRDGFGVLIIIHATKVFVQFWPKYEEKKKGKMAKIKWKLNQCVTVMDY